MPIANQTLSIDNFSAGLNLRDDELSLLDGETSFAENFEAVKKLGLVKKKGFEKSFDLPPDFYIDEVFNYTHTDGTHRFIAIAYPEILSIDPDNGNYKIIYSGLVNTGEPYGFEADGQFFYCDGANNPLVINAETVSTVTWPPSYTRQNSTEGTLDESYLATASNPSATGVGYPSFGVWHKNRVFLAGDELNPRRVYASLISDIDNFSSNSDSFNIAFFLDMPSESPITALKVISNENLVVYAEREILLMSGSNPPGRNFPQPHISVTTLSPEVGALGPRLVVSKGNNDHYFVSDRGRVFQLSLTENFQQVKPLGLSEKIFPVFESLSNETLARGRLVNYQLKGELQYLFPSTNQKRYPDQRYTLNYNDREAPSWSKDTGWTDSIRSTLINREDKRLYYINGNEFLDADKGNNYNGDAIPFEYQIRTLDFGDASLGKEVTNVTIYARSDTGATVTLQHFWENGQSGLHKFTIPGSEVKNFGDADFGVDIFTSSVGKPFSKVSFQINNPSGKIFKSRLYHNSTTEDLTISKVVFDYTVLGK